MVILDNLTPHKSAETRALIEAKPASGQGENKRKSPKQPHPPCLFAGAGG